MTFRLVDKRYRAHNPTTKNTYQAVRGYTGSSVHHYLYQNIVGTTKINLPIAGTLWLSSPKLSPTPPRIGMFIDGKRFPQCNCTHSGNQARGAQTHTYACAWRVHMVRSRIKIYTDVIEHTCTCINVECSWST